MRQIIIDKTGNASMKAAGRFFVRIKVISRNDRSSFPTVVDDTLVRLRRLGLPGMNRVFVVPKKKLFTLSKSSPSRVFDR